MVNGLTVSSADKRIQDKSSLKFRTYTWKGIKIIIYNRTMNTENRVLDLPTLRYEDTRDVYQAILASNAFGYFLTKYFLISSRLCN